MTTPSPTWNVPAKETGAALVIVLSILVLIAALLIAFMSSSRNDLAATAEYAAGQEAAALSETATSLVMAQIREATLAGISPTGQGTYAWASQPGAIRVWNNQGQPASPHVYKLYSASLMKENDLSFLDDEIPSNWRTEAASYTDVNEPVSRNGKWIYPILDPAAIGTVVGFSSSQPADNSVAWDARCSMPVRWIYIGRDGRMSNSLQPDSIGRVAFWTDDETCKININTASAGADESPIRSTRGNVAAGRLGASFWSIPYTALMQDYNYGAGNPSQDEFQRYAGHPASVNLLPVLQGPAFTTLSEAQRLNVLQGLFDLFPRYRWGGSENQRISYGQTRTNISGANQKQSRLYASVDELAFSPGKSGDSRDLNSLPATVNGSSFTDPERLNIWRFFLTATSRAPDTNLFGQPRVCLWPISGEDDPQHRTTQDNLIAFCSTIGQGADAREYFFQRLYPFSQTADWTSFPRNKEIFHFLQRSTGEAIPGFGGNFVTKYDVANGGVSGERDQILTAMFDTIRIANLNETFPGRPAGFRSYTPDAQTVGIGVSSPTYPGGATSGGAIAGAGTVFPILTEYGRGAGRIPVVSELVLHMVHRGTSNSDTGDIEPTNKIQTAFLIETFTPTLGYMPWTPRDFQATLTSSVTVNSELVFSATTKTSTARNRDTAATSRQPVGGTNGIWDLGVSLQNEESKNMVNLSGIGVVQFGRQLSQAISAPDPEVTVGAGTVEIALKMFDSNRTPTTYQNYTLDFPAATVPRPDPVVPSNTNDAGDWLFRNTANIHLIPKSEDVIRSLVPRDGDLRIIAYLQEVPHQFFRTHPDFNSTKHFAHSVRFRKLDGGWPGDPSNLNDGTTNGQLVGLPYHRSFIGAGNTLRIETTEPDLPPDITDLVARGWEGDWNNGVGDFPDGAYLFKPDEGMTKGDPNQPNYFNPWDWTQATGFYSPTQAMPSAMVFGSIPSAVRRTYQAYRNNNFNQGRPWRTLLFCPNPDFEISGSGTQHYGANNPPDYLLADLFNMPVVEPYAISEPLSTAGRINLNYQILPFTGIKRTTGLHAVLSGQRVSAIPNSLSQNANRVTPSQNDNTRIHHEIDVEETLKQFESRFSAGNLFRSATEICSIFYIPVGQTLAGIRGWWANHRMTGDNLRERPYMTSYPLLTTRSNTFTVHIRAQSLAPGKDKVTGEYRGSATIERYVDPADERLGSSKSGGVNPDTQSLEPLYRFRVVDTKRFAP